MNKAQVNSWIRGALKAGGGALAAHGITQQSATAQLIQLASGAITFLVGQLWSHFVHSDTSSSTTTPGTPAKAGFVSLRVLFLAGVMSFTVATASFVWQGCSTTAQRQAVNTIGSVETTATAAVDSYFSLVVAGKITTNDLPRVSRAYNSLQASIKTALDLVQSNTNALAPANLIIEQTDLINLINQLKGK